MAENLDMIKLLLESQIFLLERERSKWISAKDHETIRDLAEKIRECLIDHINSNPETYDGIMYAIGIEKEDEFGMTHGPTPNLQEMLKIYPSSNSFILGFEKDRTFRKLYKWDDEHLRWDAPEKTIGE